MRVTTMTPSTTNQGIEDVLCSKTRMKILKILVNSQSTPTGIAEEIGVCYSNIARHLEVLEDEGLIQHVKFGRRIRYYTFNETSSKAIAVRKLIEIFR